MPGCVGKTVGGAGVVVGGSCTTGGCGWKGG